MLTKIQLIWLELVIKYDTRDYNVIVNDIILLKWKKIHVLMISIIINNYSNEQIIYKEENLKKKGNEKMEY